MQKHGVPVTLLPVTHYTGRALPHYTIQGFIYQQLFLFGNRDTDRSPCSNLIKTRLNFYTTLAKSYKHCKLTLNTSYKKKYVG